MSEVGTYNNIRHLKTLQSRLQTRVYHIGLEISVELPGYISDGDSEVLRTCSSSVFLHQSALVTYRLSVQTSVKGSDNMVPVLQDGGVSGMRGAAHSLSPEAKSRGHHDGATFPCVALSDGTRRVWDSALASAPISIVVTMIIIIIVTMITIITSSIILTIITISISSIITVLTINTISSIIITVTILTINTITVSISSILTSSSSSPPSMSLDIVVRGTHSLG